MKRDMSIIRDLLLDIESEYTEGGFALEVTEEDDYTEEEMKYHLQLMKEAKLIKLETVLDEEEEEEELLIYGLTWDGHELLDSIREEAIWQQLVVNLKREKGSMPFSVLRKQAAKAAEAYYAAE
ncbi:Hypothetical protein SAMN05421503_2225 [Terribacillus aidingensis]|uniref:DUF2513 domain-containing protein n=1 Tax=Terribacillus aidingensis TaxID=586416 RepID=A0A285NX89_9BACI|nr:DUF2513 domain-containing protein [Terribacillus aidingensis]SNZ14094.1 Hypothetical protein SAMN05421503_2225 [Terribacillus aidingensis]